MIYAVITLSILVFLLFILDVVNNLKTKRLINSLASTNKSLNETREVVAAHEKKIKALIKSLP